MNISFPQATDATEKNPAKLLNADEIVNLFHVAHPNAEPTLEVSDKVKEWVSQIAKESGWDKVEWHGGSALLSIKTKAAHKDTPRPTDRAGRGPERGAIPTRDPLPSKF